MATAYFLGAGASAADKVPTTAKLNYGVANWLSSCGKRGDYLRTYYRDLYGVADRDLEKASGLWKAYLRKRDLGILPVLSPLPDLIETLSVLDVSIDEEQCLGMSSMRVGRDAVEMSPAFLRNVREQLSFAVGKTVEEACRRWHAVHTQRLVASLGPEDTIISTNWDMLVDRYLVNIWRKRHSGRWLRESPVRYHCVGERPVDWRGMDIGTARTSRSVLRLHGAVNWFGCACCGTVYVNLEGSYIMDPHERREDYDECHCGAGLLTMMVAPSYLKDYRSASLRSVWREAQKQLEKADEWVFIGYSLPSDDFHIRAMLMRALRSREWPRSKRKIATIRVYLHNDDDGKRARARYEDFFRISKPDVQMSGFAGWKPLRLQPASPIRSGSLRPRRTSP